MKPNLLMLGGNGASTWMIANHLRRQFGDFPLVVEDSVSSGAIFRRRAQKLGWPAALGQAAFVLGVLPWLRFTSRGRQAEIAAEFSLDATVPHTNIHRVSSVNHDQTIKILEENNPSLVIVNGTRILSQRILAAIPGRFVNLHAGITPAYRGGHGAYWALVTGRPAMAGVTVHWIDAGIDTGDILRQALIHPGPRDNFATYPLLQLGAGVPLLVEVIDEHLAGRLSAQCVAGSERAESHLYHHPTLWFYARNRIMRGVR